MAGSGSGCRHEACAHWRAPQQMQSVNAYNKKVARACWRMMLLQTLSLRLTPKLAPESRQRQQQAANTLPKQMACHRCNSSSYSSSSSSSAALHPPAPTHRAVHAAPAHMALTRVKGGSRGRYPPSYGLDIPWDHKLDIFRSRSICESCQKSGTKFLKIFFTHVPTS